LLIIFRGQSYIRDSAAATIFYAILSFSSSKNGSPKFEWAILQGLLQGSPLIELILNFEKQTEICIFERIR